MPWDVVTSLGGNLGTGILANLLTSNNAIKCYRTIGGFLSPNLPIVFRKYLSENYSMLSDIELLRFYHKEIPIIAKISGRIYVLPISYISAVSNTPADDYNLVIKTSDQVYSLPPNICIYTQPIIDILTSSRNAHFFDGTVVSMRSLCEISTNTIEITVAQGRYFAALSTNFAMDHRPLGCDASLREYLSKSNGTLGKFHSSPLVNHIGVVCMVESSDGMLVIQKRSTHVSIRPRTLSASISGAANWIDMVGGTGTSRDIRVALKRESIEELGVEPGNVMFLGLTREFLRGGKPEAYFFARSNASLNEIMRAATDAEGRKQIRELVAWRKIVRTNLQVVALVARRSANCCRCSRARSA